MSENDGEARPPPQQQQEQQDEEQLRTQMVLRLHADNLPRLGIRKTLPDTYAVVTSVSGRRRVGQGRICSGHTFQEIDCFPAGSPMGKDHVLGTSEWGRTEV